MTGPFTERHQQAALMSLALTEARLRGDDDAVRLLADPSLYDLAVPALVELLAQTLAFRMSGDGPYRQVETWRQSLLRRPTREEDHDQD